MSLAVITLAAGKGSRMKSDLPKVLHPLAGQPLLRHVLNSSMALPNAKQIVVTGHGADKVEAIFAEDNVQFAEQREQLGTGHAVMQAMPLVDDDDTVLILYGDVPLIRTDTLQSLLETAQRGLALLTITLDDPTGYGRIVRDQNDNIHAIVEQKDASLAQCQIQEVNTGILAVAAKHLNQWLPRLSSDNAQQEYYLTDIIALAVEDSVPVEAFQPQTESEVQGVNDRRQLAQLEREYQRQQADQLLIAGVTLADPARLDIRGRVTVGEDVSIDVNCVFEGDVHLADGVSVGPNCVIRNSHIGAGSHIDAFSMLDNAQLADQCSVGPYARLRPGAELSTKAKVGNFCEVKKSHIGVGSKVNHLTYIGDAEIGSHANIGAGTITCNYDGVNKFKTTIGDNAFIGSNSALVAPVTVGDGATIAAGSVITKPVDNSQLALARGKQRNLDNWQRPEKKTAK